MSLTRQLHTCLHGMQVISELFFYNPYVTTPSAPIKCTDFTSLIQVLLVLQTDQVSDSGRMQWLVCNLRSNLQHAIMPK